MTGTQTIGTSEGTRWIEDRGEAILTVVGVETSRDPLSLAARIVAAERDAFGERLQAGLATLLAAVGQRCSTLATAAACRLVGVGPGATPLGDDYLAASALTVAALGDQARFAEEARHEWLSAVLPRQLVEITTPVSAELLFDAVRGIAPEPVVELFGRDVGPDRLRACVERTTGIGATSGRAWAASIGASAILLGRAGRIRQAN